jgi:hypothetical protein
MARALSNDNPTGAEPKKACSGGSYQFWIRVHGRTGQVLHQIRLQKNIPAADIQPEVPQRREKQRLQSIGVTLYAQDCNTGPGLSNIRTMPPNRRPRRRGPC